MHFKILKMIATSGFLTALECTKFVFDPAGGAYSAPQTPSWIKGALLLRGKGGEGEEEGREGTVWRGRERRAQEAMGGERRGEKGKGGEGTAPLSEIPGSTPAPQPEAVFAKSK